MHFFLNKARIFKTTISSKIKRFCNSAWDELGVRGSRRHQNQICQISRSHRSPKLTNIQHTNHKTQKLTKQKNKEDKIQRKKHKTKKKKRLEFRNLRFGCKGLGTWILGFLD